MLRYRARIRDLEERLAAVEVLARLNSIETGALRDGLSVACAAADAGMALEGPSVRRRLRLIVGEGR